MQIACLDFEGVLIPEVWLEFSKKAAIPELARTTREEPDYEKLMRGRIEILGRRGMRLKDIQEVIASLKPLDGAKEFLDALRGRMQVVILSDTFYQFAAPFTRQLGQPTIFCHELVVDDAGRILDYRLRMPDQKKAAVKAFRALGFGTVAAGDSYNDIAMLKEADAGILFRPPANVVAEFPQFPVAQSYAELSREIARASG